MSQYFDHYIRKNKGDRMSTQTTYNFFTLYTVSLAGHACLQQSFHLMNSYLQERDMISKKRIEITFTGMNDQLKHVAKGLTYLQTLEK